MFSLGFLSEGAVSLGFLFIELLTRSIFFVLLFKLVVVHCTVDIFDAHILVEVPITVIRAVLEVKLYYGNEKFIV